MRLSFTAVRLPVAWARRGRRHEEGFMTGKFAAVAAVLSLSLAMPAAAGFRIQEADPDFPQDVTVTWFQAGKARVDGALEGLTVIVDVKGGEGWLIDSPSKRYAGGKIADLAEVLMKIEGTSDSAAAEDMTGKKAAEPAKPLTVVVKDLGPGGTLQGYDTHRYQVLVDGEVLEELWLAPKIQVASEVDLVAFGAAMQRMIGGGAGLNQGYEESEAYRALRAIGYPLRQVLFFVGEKSTLEVTSVTVKDFPASDFAGPKGFTKVDYAELLLGNGD
jgi:hypothetical protein